jgi:hypothetical protein
VQEPKELEEKKDKRLEDSWETDQAERGYYYDDAHGYEKFDPDAEDDEDDDVPENESEVSSDLP